VGPAGQRPERGGGAGRAGGIWAGKGRWAVGREQAGGLKEGLGRERVEFFFSSLFFSNLQIQTIFKPKTFKTFSNFSQNFINFSNLTQATKNYAKSKDDAHSLIDSKIIQK
jgi:hypothetical protein